MGGTPSKTWLAHPVRVIVSRSAALMHTIDRVIVMPLIPLSVPENDKIRKFVVVADDVSTR